MLLYGTTIGSKLLLCSIMKSYNMFFKYRPYLSDTVDEAYFNEIKRWDKAIFGTIIASIKYYNLYKMNCIS